jgi:hypothetical protein
MKAQTAIEYLMTLASEWKHSLLSKWLGNPHHIDSRRSARILWRIPTERISQCEQKHI